MNATPSNPAEPLAPPRLCLTLACASGPGQMAAITDLLGRHGAYVEQFAAYDDPTSQRFFVRAVFHLAAPRPTDLGALSHAFAELALGLAEVQWAIDDLGRPMRVLLMVSRFDHCLRELIAGWRRGELPMEIVGVVSNHADLATVAQAEGLRFDHLPVDPQTRPAQEARLLALTEERGAEVVVLARYMQVLSEDLCHRLAGRVINIHHSFLPGFKGARPYQQAHRRGVKLIGATAHFATSDLDEGPIIEQAVERVDHVDSETELLHAGRHVECLVLSRALRFVLERRVFINGMRTVVLR